MGLAEEHFLRSTAVALTVLLAIVAGPAGACGYEDPQSVAMGALNFAYPDALYVGTAIWQAEADGILARETPAPQTPTATPRSFAAPLLPMALLASMPPQTPMTPATSADGNSGTAGNPGANTCTSACTVALVDALSLLEKVRVRLAADAQRSTRPTLALVFASKMLWTRYLATADGVIATPHVSGPEAGEVVVITEPTVLRALSSGALSPELMFSRGLARLYGDANAVERARQWLASVAPAKP